MNKKDLIKSVATTSGLSAANTGTVIDLAFDQIADAVKAGQDVEIHGFGKFARVQRDQRQGRNPRTGEPVTIAARKQVKFKPAKALADAAA